MSRLKEKSRWRSIKCPFFHGDEDGKMNAVYCEGTAENTNVRQSFNCKQALLDWEQKYCKDIHTCERCPLYVLVNEKYKA